MILALLATANGSVAQAQCDVVEVQGRRMILRCPEAVTVATSASDVSSACRHGPDSPAAAYLPGFFLAASLSFAAGFSTDALADVEPRFDGTAGFVAAASPNTLQLVQI